jgi:Fe-S-cluster containining protein
VVRCLSLHARYRCHDSGACCSSGWPIPIEIPLYERLVASLDRGSITTVRPVAAFAPTRGLPEGAAAMLGQTEDGRCAFYEADARRCRIQRISGHAAIPIACQQFPRMCLIDPRGVHITLSHYCPTAAATLFDATPLAIVQDPPAFPADVPYEGLDAHDAFPPLLRPGVLMDWPTLDAFETHAIHVFENETQSVDLALTRLRATAERLRLWRASDGPLLDTFHAATATETAPEMKRVPHRDLDALDFETMFQRDAEVRGAVPAGSVIPGVAADAGTSRATPGDIADAYRRHVDPTWRTFTRPLCRYLAARLFANWCWYQGQGVRTLLRALEAALAVLRREAARQTLANGRMLDQNLLREAFRNTDLLLIHWCDQDTLARTWTAAEQRDEP